jgi:hypothetical protein
MSDTKRIQQVVEAEMLGIKFDMDELLYSKAGLTDMDVLTRCRHALERAYKQGVKDTIKNLNNGTHCICDCCGKYKKGCLLGTCQECI